MLEAMTHRIPRKNAYHASGRGRPLLWLVLLLALIFLGWLTYFTVAHNYYNSHAVYNGISKFRFVEECKREIQHQIDEVGQKNGQRFEFSMAKSPQEFLNDVAQIPEGGWRWVSTINLRAAGQPGSQALPFACQFEKKTGKTELLGIGGGGQ